MPRRVSGQASSSAPSPSVGVGVSAHDELRPSAEQQRYIAFGVARATAVHSPAWKRRRRRAQPRARVPAMIEMGARLQRERAPEAVVTDAHALHTFAFAPAVVGAPVRAPDAVLGQEATRAVGADRRHSARHRQGRSISHRNLNERKVLHPSSGERPWQRTTEKGDARPLVWRKHVPENPHACGEEGGRVCNRP